MIWWVAPLAAAAGFVGLCVVLRDEQRQRRAARTDDQAPEARRASPTAVRPPSGRAGQGAS